MKDKIIEMLHIQEQLDKSYMKYKKLDKLDIEKVKDALFDELGELNHEMKAEWCYWKKSQNPVNIKKVAEELADVWHFSLSLHRLYQNFRFSDGILQGHKIFYKSDKWDSILRAMGIGDENILYECIILTEKLGFTFEEIYESYIKKNKINYKRMKEGY